MIRAIRILVFLAAGLWFGGLVALFIFVTTLFRGDRAIAVEAAPRLFAVFEKYQLILAVVTILGTFIWRMRVRSGALTFAFALLALATLAAVVVMSLVSPEMESLRRAGSSNLPRFRQLHHRATWLYFAEALCLLMVNVIYPALPLALPHQIDQATDAA